MDIQAWLNPFAFGGFVHLVWSHKMGPVFVEAREWQHCSSTLPTAEAGSATGSMEAPLPRFEFCKQIDFMVMA